MLLHTIFILDGMKGGNPKRERWAQSDHIESNQSTWFVWYCWPTGVASDKIIGYLVWCNTLSPLLLLRIFSIPSNNLHSTMSVGIKYNWYSSSGPWKSKGKLSDSRPYKSCCYRCPFQPGLHILEWRDGTEHQTTSDRWGKHDYSYN